MACTYKKTNYNKHNQKMVTKVNQNKIAIIKQTRKEQRLILIDSKHSSLGNITGGR